MNYGGAFALFTVDHISTAGQPCNGSSQSDSSIYLIKAVMGNGQAHLHCITTFKFKSPPLCSARFVDIFLLDRYLRVRYMFVPWCRTSVQCRVVVLVTYAWSLLFPHRPQEWLFASSKAAIRWGERTIELRFWPWYWTYIMCGIRMYIDTTEKRCGHIFAWVLDKKLGSAGMLIGKQWNVVNKTGN